MNIEIQLNATDCRSQKHGKRRRTIIVAGEMFVPVEKINVRYLLALKAQRKLIDSK
jgi:hypothetical protein